VGFWGEERGARKCHLRQCLTQALLGGKEWGWGSSMEASVVWEFFRVERKWVLFERMV